MKFVHSQFKNILDREILQEIESYKNQLILEKNYENIMHLQGKIIGMMHTLKIGNDIEKDYGNSFIKS